MGFDARAFDRAQRRKALRQAIDKPGSIRLPPKPRKRLPPNERKKYDRRRVPLTPEQRSKIAREAALRRGHTGGVKPRTEAEKDIECDDIVAILQILCEKLNR